MYLMDVKSKRSAGEKLPNEKIYPASLTKVMTAVVAIENLKDLQQEITLDPDIFPELYARDAARAGFEPGERVRAIDLIYGALLPSGAECCIGLAEAVSGSEEAFVALMNQKAEKLRMKRRDLAVLFRYALKSKIFREVIQSHWHSTPGTNIHPDGITFYSTVFRNLSDSAVTGGEIKGGKTGYTNEAGYCLVSFFRDRGQGIYSGYRRCIQS